MNYIWEGFVSKSRRRKPNVSNIRIMTMMMMMMMLLVMSPSSTANQVTKIYCQIWPQNNLGKT